MKLDKVTGHLEVGTNENGEVVVNHPDLQPDDNGVGHIVFSPGQARGFAASLLRQADVVDPPAYIIPSVLFDIATERGRQDEQWGGPTHDDTHQATAWCDFIENQIRHVRNHEQQRQRFVKIAALAVAAVQSHDRLVKP